MFIVNIVVTCMPWIRCAMVIFDVQQLQQISKIILGFYLGVLYAPVICSARINIMIICIAMKVFTTTPNRLNRLLSHFLGKMLPPKN